MNEWKKFAWLAGIFVVAYALPLGNPKVTGAIFEAFRLLQWYAREHTLACVVPAMFIAGAISTFLSQASVMRYLGPTSNRALAYTVGSVSGVILAVCSCSVLPMFAGIYFVAEHPGHLQNLRRQEDVRFLRADRDHVHNRGHDFRHDCFVGGSG